MSTLHILLMLCSFFSQGNESTDRKIKLYCVSWDTSYKLARTTKNIKKTHLYFFETDAIWLNTMFVDYDDAVEKLSKQEMFTLVDTGKIIETRALAELYFSDKEIINVFFNEHGDFYFNKQWHKRKDNFYYLLFKYFSDEIIPPLTLQEASKNYKNNLW